MLTVEQWAKQSIEARKGASVPWVISPNQWKSFEEAGIDMAHFAVQSPIPTTK